MRRTLATVLTLGLLSGMLFALIVALMLIAGVVEFGLAVVLVVLFNLVMLLVSPTINDLVYRWLYDLEWVDLAEVRERSPESAAVIEEVTDDYGYSQPKLGVIPDRNPTAFTYGSGRFNARIVVTEGCFEFLDDDELASVYAHELGHVTSRDFIVMTLANTTVQLLYLVAVRGVRYAQLGAASSQKGDPRMALYAVAVLAYVFYVVGEYAVLYLSRVREYAADAFAARYTDGDYLSSALIKLAYGIVVSEDNPELARVTRNIGLMNFDQSRDKGLLYYNCRNLEEFGPLARAIQYDLHSPWAKLGEIRSTHPLTGKRIRELSGGGSVAGMIDFASLDEKYPVDRTRLYGGFARDLAITRLPGVLFLVGVVAGLAVFGFGGVFALLGALGVGIALYGVAAVVRANYRFPGGEPDATTVMDLLGDVYASPVHGRFAALSGEIIGRGQAGYAFGSDVMFRDDTGLMYVRYQSWLPGLGNLLFALSEVPELVGERVEIDGWFFRSTSPWFVMRHLSAADRDATGYLHYQSLAGAAFAVVLGGALVAVALLL